MVPAYAVMDVGFAALLGVQGEPATYTPAGGQPVAVTVLFNEAQTVIDPQTQTSTTKPVARAWSSSMPNARNGDRLSIRGVAYYLTEPQIDGYGTTNLFLSRDTQVPIAPSGLTVVNEANKARLNWTRNANNETNVEVWSYNTTGDPIFVLIATLATGVATYLDTASFLPGETFTYKVRNINGAGPSPFSNQASIS